MDGNKALAALFAAATASASPAQQQKVLMLPETRTNIDSDIKKESIQSSPIKQTTQAMSASNLISSLLNRSAQSSSLPPTNTTATYTTTIAEPSRESTSKSASVSRKAGPSQQPGVSSELVSDNVELRNLESWFDEDAEKIDESQYQELVDSGDLNGWSADEMFKYNEKRHKIMSSFNHRTLSQRYSTPLSKNKSKLNSNLASKLAEEIKERAIAVGRVTPESSDDDEQFEQERRRRLQLKQLKQLDQLKNLNSATNDQCNNQKQDRRSSTIRKPGCNNYKSPIASHNISARKVSKPNSQLSDSSATPATISSTSSSPKPIDSSIISTSSSKSISSSSRNILRTSLI